MQTGVRRDAGPHDGRYAVSAAEQVLFGAGQGRVEQVDGRSSSALAVGIGEEECPSELLKYDWPYDEACRVAWCESRWQADAIGGPNIGLFQVWAGWARVFDVSVADLLDVRINVRVAYGIWLREGWRPWSCKP